MTRLAGMALDGWAYYRALAYHVGCIGRWQVLPRHLHLLQRHLDQLHAKRANVCRKEKLAKHFGHSQQQRARLQARLI